MSEQIVTYEPDNSLKRGYFSVLVEISLELKNNIWLTAQLFKRSFLSTYKQSFVGILWALIIPLLSVGTFIVLNQAGIFKAGAMTVPYVVYAVLGLSFWQIFATGIVTSANSLVSAGSMLTKINFSKKSLVIASAGQALISFVIQIVLLLFLFVYYQIAPTWWVLMIPIFIIPVFSLMLGCGFIFALLNGIARDIGNILSVSITFLMFLTPILYLKPTAGFLSVVSSYNPLYYLIAVPRDLILFGNSPDWLGFAISTIFSFFCFFVCIIVFHITETRIAERI